MARGLEEKLGLIVMKNCEEQGKKIEETIPNIEGEDHLKYEWIDLDKIDEYNLLPIAVKEILKKGEYPTHKINIGENECLNLNLTNLT